MSDSLQLHGLYSPWNSPGQNTKVGSLSLLQGIFPIQGLNPGFPPCMQILYCLQCRRPGFNPWVGKIPWRRERLPTSVFWPGELHGLYSPWGCKELDMTERLSLSHAVEFNLLVSWRLCIYVQKYWPIVFLCCLWFWNQGDAGLIKWV